MERWGAPCQDDEVRAVVEEIGAGLARHIESGRLEASDVIRVIATLLVNAPLNFTPRRHAIAAGEQAAKDVANYLRACLEAEDRPGN